MADRSEKHRYVMVDAWTGIVDPGVSPRVMSEAAANRENRDLHVCRYGKAWVEHSRVVSGKVAC